MAFSLPHIGNIFFLLCQLSKDSPKEYAGFCIAYNLYGVVDIKFSVYSFCIISFKHEALHHLNNKVIMIINDSISEHTPGD
jgi:hypothetical protein